MRFEKSIECELVVRTIGSPSEAASVPDLVAAVQSLDPDELGEFTRLAGFMRLTGRARKDVLETPDVKVGYPKFTALWTKPCTLGNGKTSTQYMVSVVLAEDWPVSIRIKGELFEVLSRAGVVLLDAEP